MYNIDEARPQKIEVDSKTGDELNISTKKQLKASLKCFKMFDLETAFHKMLIKKPFTWSREDEEDSPLETNCLSCSEEEGYLENFSFVQKKRLKLRKRQKKSEIELNGTKRRSVYDFPESSESNNQSVSQENKEPVKNLRSMRKKIQEIKLQKLKQTKLRFLVDNNSELRTDNSIVTSRAMAIEKKTRIAELHEPFASTPIHENHPSTSRLVSVMSLDNISDIPANEDSSNDTKTKTNADVPKQTESLSKDQLGDKVTAEMLKSGMKRNAKSLIRSKSIIKKKNISRKKVKKT